MVDDDLRRAEPWLLLLAGAFVLANSAALALARPDTGVWSRLQPLALWCAAIGGAAWLLRRYRPLHDPFLLPVYALLTGWGLLLQARLAPNFSGRHMLWFALGTAVLTAIAVLPRSLRLVRAYRYTWLTAGLLLLAATLWFGVNPSGYGLALWLPVPFVGAYFQPSELLKLLIVFFFAGYFADRGRLIQTQQQRGWRSALPYLAPLTLMWGFCVVLLVWQQDLGAAAIFFLFFLTLLYTATGRRRYYVVGLLLLLTAGVIGYFAFDLVALRVETWWNPWPEFDRRGFQIAQALYALAAGGVVGAGIGQGTPTFIPVVHSDFAFAAIAEEWGLIGALTVIGCFAVLAQRGLRIATLAANTFRMYLALGIVVLISVQALLIMGGVVKLLPLTGVTLPFLSYGGSSLLVACAMVGLLLYLSEEEEEEVRR